MSEILFLEKALDNTNVKAFLTMIRKSEGTDAADGYSYIFGSSPQNNERSFGFEKHPDIKVPFRGGFSTAAGAYQLLTGTWNELQAQLSLPDFSPHSQDLACVALLSQRNCLQRLMNGDLDFALHQAAGIWASLPGNNYGQPEHDLATVHDWYSRAGGMVTA